MKLIEEVTEKDLFYESLLKSMENRKEKMENFIQNEDKNFVK